SLHWLGLAVLVCTAQIPRVGVEGCFGEFLSSKGFSAPLAHRRSSCPPTSPNLMRTHLI
ncbi:unnamed protein product, partial [Ascophyllum nodosum]